MTSWKYVTYVVSEDDAPLPDLILPVDLRQATQQPLKYHHYIGKSAVSQWEVRTEASSGVIGAILKSDVKIRVY